MDHTYDFHIVLSYIQLNEFEKAEKIFKNDIQKEVEKWGEDGYHHLDLFYCGVSLYEQKKWEEAIVQFNKALEKYPLFSDVMYYKSIYLMQLYEKAEAMEVYKEAKLNGEKGNTINEDNSLYETYPYQIRW